MYQLLILVGLVLISPAFAAEALPKPTGNVVLTIAGNIRPVGGDGPVDLDLAGLESLGTVELVTETPFQRGVLRFAGVPLARLLSAVGAQGDVVRATALNDYAFDIPISDAEQFDVLVATRLSGEPMRVRDKGPLWIVYPWSERRELAKPIYAARSIWQLRTLQVR